MRHGRYRHPARRPIKGLARLDFRDQLPPRYTLADVSFPDLIGMTFNVRDEPVGRMLSGIDPCPDGVTAWAAVELQLSPEEAEEAFPLGFILDEVD